jgi:hypothetical protein
MASKTQVNMSRLKPSLILLVSAVLLLAVVFVHRQLPIVILLDVTLLVICSVLPGVAIVRSLSKQSLPRIELLTLGAATGVVLVPLLFSLLALIGLHSWTAYTAAIAGLTMLALQRRHPTAQREPHFYSAIWGALIVILIFLEWFSFECLHFNSRGDLVTRVLFGYDLPYLSSFVASLRDNGKLLDLHQLNISYPYHDYCYRLLAAVGSISKSDALVLNSFSASIFFYWFSLLSLFALAQAITKDARFAAIVALSQHFLGSLIGSEQGSMALSPSSAAGNILLYSSLLVLFKGLKDKIKWSSFETALLTILLCGLIRTKLTTYFVLGAGLGICSLLLIIRKQYQDTLLPALPLLVSLVVFALSSPASQFAPASDFLVGAPLLGYANHIAAILHIPVATINPVAHGLDFGFRQLLIIPYFGFHLLRFAVSDERFLLVLAAIVLFRKQIARTYSHADMPAFYWTLALMLPIGFLLPVLYSPAWYALALSFYGPYVSIEVARLLSLLTIRGVWIQEKSQRRTAFLWIASALLLVGVFQNARVIRLLDTDPPYVISKERITGLHYLRDHSKPNELVASRRFHIHDTDESYYLYSAIAERPMVSEGATYGSLLGAVSGIDSIKGLGRVKAAEDTLKVHREVLDSVYLSTSTSSVHDAIRKYDIRYVLVDKEINQQLATDPRRYADSIFANSSLEIWKVRR